MADLKKTVLDREKTGISIALILVFTFIASLIWLMIMNTISYDKTYNSKDSSIWFDLLKAGLVLLGTAMTTVIGYYFGQKDSTELRKENVEIRSKIKDTKIELEKEYKNAEEIILEKNRTIDKLMTAIENAKHVKSTDVIRRSPVKSN